MKHNSMHQWHKEHNKRVAEFHKNHAAQVANGENGNGWLAKLETSFFNKVLVPLKVTK
ncbi:hypothetical protein [Peribacillus butanolivorans]|uniref:hypothetical protein n=1 Tax=Peribacillus butanolivorans TaxID=421767 RepID=UPI0013C2CB50|nr:hypothetical protein [Peribacillus butanolivorans]